jgi:hypothetical protein
MFPFQPLIRVTSGLIDFASPVVKERSADTQPTVHQIRLTLAVMIQKISHETHESHENQRRRGITTLGHNLHNRVNESEVWFLS